MIRRQWQKVALHLLGDNLTSAKIKGIAQIATRLRL
ncbi:hypothetical protein DK59_3114 [Brucella abortus bv. 4 str. 292]|nr:hypothetical protein DK59_3114 [Brucella abortus bv. 4 str. 292]